MLFYKLICHLSFSFFLQCIIFAQSLAVSNDMQLVFIQALWRHGDRTPTDTWPNDACKESDWKMGGGGWGELTPTGMKQHLGLGMKLRNRYINATGPFPGFLSSRYKSNEIYVRSTDVNRTLISAFSNLLGLYGQANYGNDNKLDYPDVQGWPLGLVPIPIHTVYHDTDFAINTDAICPLKDKWWAIALQSDEVRNFSNSPDVTKMLAYLSNGTGQNTTIDNLSTVTGTLFIEKIYFPDRVKQSYQWYTDDIYNQADAMTDQVNLFKNGVFKNPNLYNGIDIGLQLKRLKGGFLVDEMNSRIQNKIDCLNKTNNCIHWMDNLKAYLYSGHDTILYAFFSALGVEEYAVKPQGSYPQYSACAIIELYQNTKSKDYFFKLIYHVNETTEFDDVTKGIPECANATEFCPISALQQITDRVRPEQPIEKWCLTDIPTGLSSPFTIFLTYIIVTVAHLVDI